MRVRERERERKKSKGDNLSDRVTWNSCVCEFYLTPIQIHAELTLFEHYLTRNEKYTSQHFTTNREEKSVVNILLPTEVIARGPNSVLF